MNPDPSLSKDTESNSNVANDTDGAEEPKCETDDTQQEELRKAYILQQMRMRCPGCGEGDETF